MSHDTLVHARRWKTLGVLSLSLLIIGLDNTVLNVALPSLQEAFGASSSTLQWIVDAYLLVFAGLLLTMGTLGDRFGRKRALQGGLMLFGAGSVLAPFASSAGQLIAVRGLMGAGGALIMPATLSIISNVFPREERGKAIGIWSGMASVGIGLGPLLGGLLLEWFDWSSVFVINVPVVAAALLLGTRLVPESRDPQPGAFDLLAASLSVAALTALVYGIIEAPNRGWTDSRILGCFAAAAALGYAFVRWELRAPEPMLNLSFLRERRFSVASMAIGLASFALFGASFGGTQFLQDAHGYSALDAGAAMVPLAFGLVMGAMSSVRLVRRFGTTKVVAFGLLHLAFSLTMSLTWAADMPYVPIGAWFFGVALSMGFILGPSTASVMSSVPESKAGVASAMNDVTRQVGGALGTAVIGSLVSSLYASRIGDSITRLPDALQSTTRDSIGKANVVAAHLPGDAGAQLKHAAASAFTDALGLGLAVAAGCAALAAVAVILWLPPRPLPAEPELVIEAIVPLPEEEPLAA